MVRHALARTLALVVFTGLVFGVRFAAAETAPEERAIEEVVVTALKRETRLMETPLAVSAFDGEKLDDVGANSLGDFLQFAPGVTFDGQNSARQNVFIRGLASTFSNSPIGFYYDEVPFSTLTLTVTPDVRSFDLERVEVLRGPQGTLYGASSLGGTIRILTNDPAHNEFGGKVDISYSGTDGGDNNHAVKAAVNIPLIDSRLSLRLVGTDEFDDGWIDHTNALGVTTPHANDNDVSTTRAKLLWTLADNADLVLSYWRTGAKTDNSNIANDTGVSQAGSIFNVMNPSNVFEVYSELYSAVFEVDFWGGTLTSSTSLMDYDFDSLLDTVIIDNDVEITTQEFRFTSNPGNDLIWTLGAIYSKNETDLSFIADFPALFFVLDSTQNLASKSYAAYGEATYSVSEFFDLTFGLRYFDDDVTRSDVAITGPIPPFFPEFTTVTDDSNRYTDWSPRFNVSLTLDQDRLLFATVSKGFRSGLTQLGSSIAIDPSLAGQDVDPEVAWNYELGSKLTLAEGRMTVDAVVYYIDWNDLQTTLINTRGTSVIFNAGEAKGHGLEMAATWVPNANLTFTLAGNYNNTTYAETLLSRDGTNSVIFESGQQFDLVPELTVTGSADLVFAVPGGWDGVGRASVEHVGRRTLTHATFTTLEGDESTRLNLRIGLEKGQLGIHLFAENVTNDDSRIMPSGFVTLPDPSIASRYRARTVGLNAKFLF